MLDNQTDSDGLTIAPLQLDLPKPCEHQKNSSDWNTQTHKGNRDYNGDFPEK
jgi:hypothetical protein